MEYGHVGMEGSLVKVGWAAREHSRVPSSSGVRLKKKMENYTRVHISLFDL